MEKVERRYEFTGSIVDNFGREVERIHEIVWGKSKAHAQNKMLFAYKRDSGLDPKHSVRRFEGKVEVLPGERPAK